MKIKYMPHIDGLRSIAVLPVILYHAGFDFFSGGFVGVDVFFVLSGFLISSIILVEIENEKFSFFEFYSRRAKRILPALYFMFFLALISSLYFLPPHLLKDFGQSLFSAALFISNIFFYVETDYFNDYSQTSPLLHTWSLSVEEQFYLVIPLILVFFSRYSRAILLLTLLILCVLSFWLSLSVTHDDSSLAFYMMPMRFWELGLGVLLGAWFSDKKVDITNHTRISYQMASFFCVAGLLLIVYPMVSYDHRTVFPGVAALPPVIGTCFIILSSRYPNVLSGLLSASPLVTVGVYSYSLYLSHQMVFAVIRASEFEFRSSLGLFLAFSISVLLAYFSYHFVERPFRKAKLGNTFVLISSCVVAIAFALAGLYLHNMEGLKEYKLNALSDEQKEKIFDVEYEQGARKVLWDKVLTDAARSHDLSAEKKILILGDSKAEDLYVGVRVNEQYLAETSVRMLRLDDRCMQAEVIYESSPQCRSELELVLNSPLLLESDTVILSATWEYLSNDGVISFARHLIDKEKRVKIVSTANFSDVGSLAYVMAGRDFNEEEAQAYLYTNIRSDWERQFAILSTLLQELDSGRGKIQVIDKLEAFCSHVSRTCILSDSGGWYMWDSGHLTSRGAAIFGQYAIKNDWLK